MEGFTPVIIIEGFLGLGVVVLLYVLHLREMKKIRAERARRSPSEAQDSALNEKTAHPPDFKQ